MEQLALAWVAPWDRPDPDLVWVTAEPDPWGYHHAWVVVRERFRVAAKARGADEAVAAAERMADDEEARGQAAAVVEETER